jgi:hypothetical protein
MTKLSIKQIEAWDKQKAALHEAAHLTVAVAKGVVARAAIRYVGKSVDPKAFATWEGYCQMITPVGKHKAVCCVAGEVSRYLDGESGQTLYEDIEQRAEEGGVSATDLAGYPKSKRKLYAVIDEAAALLQIHRKYFDWATHELLEDGEISAGEAWMRFHGLPEERMGDESACAQNGKRTRKGKSRKESARNDS